MAKTPNEITQPVLTYGLVVYRKDEQHIVVLRSQDYKKCLKTWQELHDKWTTSHKEAIPFVLKEPEVTAFEPGLIKEIKIIIVPSTMTEGAVDPENPYVKQMMQQGFSQSFPRQGNQRPGLDILDSGYSR